jgi:hypothetical protein
MAGLNEGKASATHSRRGAETLASDTWKREGSSWAKFHCKSLCQTSPTSHPSLTLSTPLACPPLQAWARGPPCLNFARS